MPKVGIEPTRPFGHRILSPARLPVPPLRLSPIVAPPDVGCARDERGVRMRQIKLRERPKTCRSREEAILAADDDIFAIL